MANQYGLFWNSVSGDRTYDADSFAEWTRKFFTSGVFNGDLQVTPYSGMTVNVGTGYANIEGKVRFFDAATTFTISPASGSYPRIDTIVVRSDIENRIISLQYVEGEYSGLNPVPTAPVRTGGIYELVLAQIAVGAGATQIEVGDITDTRADDNLCGWVTGSVDSVNVSQLTAQAQAQFDVWFENMKDQLDSDAAGHLQNEIDEINEKIQQQVEVTVLANSWSNSTVTINGTAYYTYDIQLTGLYVESPTIGIGAINTLPTEAEQEAYNSWAYATVDTETNIVTLYAESVPTDNFNIIIHDATV